MIDIRPHIYDTITGDTAITALVDQEVHIFQDGKDVREGYEDKWPQITYGRYAPARVNRIWVRVEFFQISSWAKTLTDAEAISREVIRVFNRKDNDVCRSCTLSSVDDTYDPETKSFWVHTRFTFVIYDPDY